MPGLIRLELLTDFFNKIGPKATLSQCYCALAQSPFQSIGLSRYDAAYQAQGEANETAL